MVEYHPVPFHELKKGDAFSRQELERITGKKSGTKEYSFAVLQLGKQIEDETEKLGRPMHTRIVQENLEIMLDAEDATYQDRQVRSGCRKIVRSYRKQMQVDCHQLTDEEQQLHDKRCILNGRLVIALKRARRIPKPKPNSEDNGPAAIEE